MEKQLEKIEQTKKKEQEKEIHPPPLLLPPPVNIQDILLTLVSLACHHLSLYLILTLLLLYLSPFLYFSFSRC